MGTEVKAIFSLRGRPYTGRDQVTKHFGSLNCFKVEFDRDAIQHDPSPDPPPQDGAGLPGIPQGNDAIDNIPF
jgi:hypothetical protein